MTELDFIFDEVLSLLDENDLECLNGFSISTEEMYE